MLSRVDRQRLLAAFQLTDAELDVNRRGELTDRQRQRLRSEADGDATFMAGLALVLGVVLYGIGGYLAHVGLMLFMVGAAASSFARPSAWPRGGSLKAKAM